MERLETHAWVAGARPSFNVNGAVDI